ncbi:hypothetical protein LELG_03398 [Lodderomyces elongisporus NRRL YB-4239]|uniref:FAR1 domain-containing protein n=1 Tax=Lodderomyces elongisporus (strain ATCC 11503 / CBS 2605 / JCM 1781 / NBRC 1676 / NRRL YB-4239) TaxID=379508 RepID=A5E1B1_LODEL|nr:hypothetical protein LELG_03398 [Lodderomyces elongisporus NRRL YB-4239]
MSLQEDDFTSNIDEQLLSSVDPHGVKLKLEEIAHAAALSSQNSQQHSPEASAAQFDAGALQTQHQHQHQNQDQDQIQNQNQNLNHNQNQDQEQEHDQKASRRNRISSKEKNVVNAANQDDFRQFQLQQQLQLQQQQHHQQQQQQHQQIEQDFNRQQQQQLQHHAQQQAVAAVGLNNYTHSQQHQQQQQQFQHHQQQQLQHHHQHQHQHQHHQIPELQGPTAEELSEYNIQIPEPIIDAKLKIFPVTENTITAEGNLITRPYPEQIFNDRDGLNEFIAEFARDNGFGIVIAHSNKKAIYYTCELGGRYRHKKSKKIDVSKQIDVGDGYMLDPDTKTKKLKCPFSMTASFKKSTGMWTLRTTCNEHNHPQLDPLLNHPMLRKRSDELNLVILELYKLGTKPSHIESKIRSQYPDVMIKREDIYNEIRGYKRKLKKQTSRFGFNNPSRIANAQYRKKAAQQAAAAAAAASAAANAVVVGGEVGAHGTGSSAPDNNPGVVDLPSSSNNDASDQVSGLSLGVSGVQGTNEVDPVAAVTAAANANAFLQGDGQELQYDPYQQHQQHQQFQPQQLHQQSQQQQQQQQQQEQQEHQEHQEHQELSQSTNQQQQQQQEEFQRQFVAATQLDEQQYQQYQQHLQEHGLQDNDNAATAAAIAAARHHYADSADLSMDNIDSRLVGE